MVKESNFLQSRVRLHNIKLYGDLILFGGTEGFIGLGFITPTQDEDPAAAASSPSLSIKCLSLDIASASASDNIINPHSKAASITGFAVAEKSAVFASFDSMGCFSLWHHPRHSNLCSLSAADSVIRSSAAGTEYKESGKRPELICHVDVNSLVSSDPMNGTAAERIMKLSFVCSDTYLLVSTNRRLLLFVIQHSKQSEMGQSDSFKSFGTNSTIEGLSSWIEVDRSLEGCRSIFDMHFKEEHWFTKDPGTQERTCHVKRRIVQWRLMEDEPSNASTSATVPCTVSRFEWTEDMFQDALNNGKPLDAGAGAPHTPVPRESES